ncbi:MAG: tRNA uridine-5-carboxymethylaminomethyl(34) synthesis GTPase MnmE [Nitrospirae bacterium]|nr:tRNA uridine-5-carboxymethylaminomethyl(34) synthesis GTPase MnmE [Nitrospirota bacterium]
MRNDTIVAISTPPGIGALGIVRLSGPEALDIAARSFDPVGARHASPLQPRHAHFGRLVDHDTGETVDEGILTWFPAPNSYTGEDVVEMSLHGNPLILEKAVGLLCRLGARSASPGEFTRRAFLNGKIDLAQSEAVADIIGASSEAALRAARRVKQGDLSREVANLREEIIAALGYTEAVIDFAEEPDVQEHARVDIETRLKKCESMITGLLALHGKARRLREGSIALLAGEPNVGKSSLMNRLTGRDVSIVHPTPGTTRDVVREWIEMDGFPVELHDTAGLRPTSHLSPLTSHDEIESQGIARTKDLFDQADLIVWVLDASAPRGVRSVEEFAQWMNQANGSLARSIFVLNKSDLGSTVDLSWLPSPSTDVVRVSALTGEGVGNLRRALGEKLASGIQSNSEMLLLRPRHVQSLEMARASIQECRNRPLGETAPDLLAIDLREAVAHLDEITGTISTEDLLDRVFSDFCVGK